LAKLYLADPDGQNIKKIADDVSQQFSPLWSPNSQYIYYSAYTDTKLSQATHKIYDVAKSTATDLGEEAANMRFSPDSSQLAYTVISTVVRVLGSDDPPGSPTKVNVTLL
jgi:Tol biopolymer transport system component